MGVLTLLVASAIIFAATQALPGDAARAILGQQATPERLAEVRHELNLDRSKPAQYWDWLTHAVRGDLGTSLTSTTLDQPVTAYVGPRALNSLILVALAMLVTAPVAVLLGAISAYRRDRASDHAISVVSLGLAALPDFAIALGLVLLLSTSVFHLLPAVSTFESTASIASHGEMLVLPVLTLVVWEAPYIARIMRAALIDVLESDYVEMARLKGMPERRVILRHALPNAVVPLIQVLAVQTSFLAGSIVVVEFVFGYPGIGQGLIQAVSARDVPTVQAITLLVVAVYVVINLVSDALTILVTPRLRTTFR
jgi:peptide/nickel transport system permease protein